MLNSRYCRSILTGADSNFIRFLCDCFVNVFLGHVPANKSFIESKKIPFGKIVDPKFSIRRDLNPPLRRLDRQLSNPKPSNPTKEKPRKKNFFPPPTTTMTTMIKTMKAVKNRLRRRQQKNGNPTISEEKKLKLLYTKGPAAFGSVKNLTNASQLSPKKV